MERRDAASGDIVVLKAEFERYPRQFIRQASTERRVIVQHPSGRVSAVYGGSLAVSRGAPEPRAAVARSADVATTFNELRQKMSPERRLRNAAEAERMLLDVTLQELREDIPNLNQEDIAELLQVTQGYVSRLKRQEDIS